MKYSPLLILFFLLSAFSTGDSPSLIESRLKSIQNEVPLVYNKTVDSYIKVYEVKKRSLTETMLAKKEYYFPTFEKILAQYGLPDELKYMAVIESALKPQARSRVGAKGLWQFMYGTAKEYKLNVNSYVDERSDTELSTAAAALYLKKMYARFGDWSLAIASYNCGPGNVNKAIRRSGGKRDFWSIYRYLPRETRGYVPAFIAAMYVFEYADVLGLNPNFNGTEYLTYEPISFRKELLASDLIEQLGLDEEHFRNANASLSGDIIPEKYTLRMPSDKHAKFYELSDTLYASAAFKIEKYGLRKKTKTYGPIQRLIPSDPNLESILYTIKEGDNLGYIAYWYDTGLSNLKAWNGITRNKIILGQELIIYVHKDKLAMYSQFDKLSNRQKNILSSDRNERMLYAKRFDDKYIYHEVQKGDTFWKIINQYENASIDEVKALNHVDDRSIKPGMFLKIMEKDA